MDPRSTINIKSFCFNPFCENTYILWSEGGNCVIVDPGCYDDPEHTVLESFVGRKGLKPCAIWLTHGHFDHIFGVSRLVRDYQVPVFMSREDRFILDKDGEYASGVGLMRPDATFETDDLSEGQILRIGLDDDAPAFRVISTPGHTPGGVCFYSEECGVLLSGDTLFAGAIGRTDLEGGDYDKEIVGIMEKLMVLPGDVDVLPGHGPRSSIAEERTGNPFLQPFNEPWETEIETD